MTKFVRNYGTVGLADVALVGGKNASLGEMIQGLANQGIRVPDGFVVTAEAYSELISNAGIGKDLAILFKDLDTRDTDDLARRGQQARSLIKQAGLPETVKKEICKAYQHLEELYGQGVDVAVRSSATAEDLPEASFAGQQESFLNIRGEVALLEACLNCFASLFTDRAISYRVDKGFDQMSVKLSIGVQKMVRSDLAVSGVIFTLDPESGFRNAVLITSAYGLGENIVAGRVDPDEFLVFKSTLNTHPTPIIRTKVGAKQVRMIYAGHGTRTTKNTAVAPEEREKLSLTEAEVLLLARWACKIEQFYSHRYGHATAMDIEWAKDGITGQLYIVQARPETIHGAEPARVLHNSRLVEKGPVLLTGRSIGEKVGSGKPRVILSVRDLGSFLDGEVLVADMTDPDWEPIMKKASAIVTNRGGRTCHAAIVSRELGVPCVVGTERATELLAEAQAVTVSCADGATGYVYDGILPVETEEIRLDEIPWTRTRILVNAGNPEHAFSLASLPVEGVGLAREEFIIANEVKVHPLALTRFDSITDTATKEAINKLTHGYTSKEEYFVCKLAEGIAMIAAAFYPREVIVRLSDFKTNEYANLLGGKYFEPSESNPMIGFRGASRYYDERYKDGFALECKALLRVRQDMGLTNVKVMIPFCRTVAEGQLVLKEMAKNGLVHGQNGLEVYIMCELPSNVLCIDRFAELFDGFSIGSNDLTQLILGLDRDSEIVAALFDERDEAVKKAIAMAIAGAHKAGRKIGICGQAPSDYPEVVRFLIENEIDSISLNEDVVLKTLLMVAQAEKDLGIGTAQPIKPVLSATA
jgi:pyruvate, water dikinase